MVFSSLFVLIEVAFGPSFDVNKLCRSPESDGRATGTGNEAGPESYTADGDRTDTRRLFSTVEGTLDNSILVSVALETLYKSFQTLPSFCKCTLVIRKDVLWDVQFLLGDLTIDCRFRTEELFIR